MAARPACSFQRRLGCGTGGNGGRVGAYRVGAWISTWPMVGVVTGELRPTPPSDLSQIERTSSYGLWASAQQQLTGRSVDGASVSGVTVFLKVVQTDRRTLLIDNQVAAGMFMKGLIASVLSGELGFGIARPHINGRLARAELLAGRPGQASQFELERHYGFRPLRCLQLRPNLQWVHHAGGFSSVRGVGVAGVKSELTF